MVHADKQEEKFSTDWGPAPLHEDRNCDELSSRQRDLFGLDRESPCRTLWACTVLCLGGTLTVPEGTLTPGARQEITTLSPLFGALG